MKNKKGFELLGNQVVMMLIAVLCILVLVYAGYRVFGLFQDKSEMEKAEGNLQNFVTEFDNFVKGIEIQGEFIILGPEDWSFSSYRKEDLTLPEKCKGFENCICFCYFDSGHNVNDCNKKGFCLETSGYLEIPSDYPYHKRIFIKDVPYILSLSKTDGGIIKIAK